MWVTNVINAHNTAFIAKSHKFSYNLDKVFIIIKIFNFIRSISVYGPINQKYKFISSLNNQYIVYVSDAVPITTDLMIVVIQFPILLLFAFIIQILKL